MATVESSVDRRFTRMGIEGGASSKPCRRSALLTPHSVICLAVLSWLPTPSFSQSWRLEPSIGTTLTATNNSGLSLGAEPAKDIVVDIEPRLIVQARGASFSLDGNLGAHGLQYANSSQPNRFLPSGTIALNANLVDRWLYFDASALAEQVAADPYAARLENDSGFNKVSTVQYRVSPYLLHSFTSSLSLSMRSDHVWTRRRGDFVQTDPRRNSVAEKESVALEQKPLPFGFSIEAAQEKTSYLTGVETVLQIGSARGVATYAVDPTFVVGVTGGVEKTEYALSNSNDKIVGARITWAPTERTELRGSLERRFFGSGGALQLSHRSPFIGIKLDVSREPNALGTSFVLNPNGGDVQTLLDAIFTTRYPNPVDRATIVKNVISGLGIPSVLREPVEVFADYAQLKDSATASMVVQGVRSTFVTRIYAIRSRQLNQADKPLVPTLAAGADNYQKGVSMDFNRRLTPTLSIDVGVGYASIAGLGVADGQSTKNQAARVGFTQILTPKTKVILGARYQRTDQATPGADASAEEVAGFVGMVHRF